MVMLYRNQGVPDNLQLVCLSRHEGGVLIIVRNTVFTITVCYLTTYTYTQACKTAVPRMAKSTPAKDRIGH